MFRYLFASAIAFAMAFLYLPAFAGYAQLSPPSGMVTSGGVTTIPVSAAANGARYGGGYVAANAGLNLGARSVVVPVGLRVAANAATFAATKLNPWLAGASLIASAIPLVADWLTRDPSGMEVDPDGKISVPGTPGGPIPAPQGDAWVLGPNGTPMLASEAGMQSCAAGTFIDTSACTNGQTTGRKPNCSNGQSTPCFLSTSAPTQPGTPARQPTEAEVAALGNAPVNPALLPELGQPIPVDPEPVINPESFPTGDVLIGPNGNPAPQLQPSAEPLRYPDGDPVPNPNTNPQTYTQPWHEVVPSPAPGNPWRVDVRPVTTITTNPNPAPDPVPNPNPNPNPNPSGTFYTDCDKYPTSLGCAPLDSLPDVEIPTVTKNITLQTGPEFSGGSCPADVVVAIGAQSVKAVDMQQACGFISSWVRPLLLLLASITAIGIVMPKD